MPYCMVTANTTEPVIFCQCHADDLVHVVVAIGGQAADEGDAGHGHGGVALEVLREGGLLGEFLVFLVLRRRIRGRDRVVGFLSGAVVVRILTNDGGVAARLARGVFHLHDAGEFLFVGIIDLHGRLPEAGLAGGGLAGLELFFGEAFGLEAQRAVGQAAEL